NQNDSNDQEAREFVAYNAHTIARADLTTWHRRLGHINYDYVLEMVRKGAVEGMDIVGSRSPPSRCEPCIKGKQTRAPFPDSQNRASELLELMFSDLHGPTAIQAIGGFRYFSVTIDDKSRKMFVHILKSKDEYAGIFKELKALVENQTGKRVKALRTDGGGEYASTAFEKWMREQGIEHQKTEANSSASNGVAERAIRTLNDFQRTMRIDADMSDKYWGYAVKHAAHLWNITPKRFLNGRTPDEVFTGKKPDVARLRTFGCKAWARIPDDRRTKLQARSVECRYLGYAPNRKAHLLVERVSQRILTSRDVVFDEDGERRQRVIIEDYDVERVPKEVGDAETKPKVEPSEPDDSDVKSEGESAKSEPESEARTRSPSPMPAEPPPVETPPEPRRSTRETRPPVRYGANVGVDDLSLLLSNPHIVEFAFAADLKSPPLTFAEAMARPDANLWLGAMVEELESIQKHGVYKETDRPGDRNVVGCRWIFSFKFGPDGEVVRYKARLVAKGFSQREGVDFGETSSPVAASDSWRVILGIATSEDLEMLQLDIKTAFLHGEVEEEIYMEQPEGFGKGDGRVWKLAKALYGLKQAARAFYMKLRGVLEKIGFTKCETDHAVFWCREDDKLAIILAHVDDMLLVGKPLSFLEGFKSEMAKFFDIVDLGEPRMFVGVEIQRDREAGTLKISQRRYIKDILDRFQMSDSKPVNTPMAESPNLPKLDSPTIDRTLYQRGIGSLMYAMVSTRPDIAYATGLLAQHAANPGEDHWASLKRVLRYLQGTIEVGIVYDRSKPSELIGYVDSDYAGDKNSSRSTTGWTFQIAGGSVAWSSRKQPTISLSSTEAEYVAASSATRELSWIRQFLSEIGFLSNNPTILFTDNQSSMALAKNPINHQNTKHIRVKYHFIREMIELREVDLKYIPTDEQVADVLTKPLGRIKFPFFVLHLGMS
ncbi:putative Gag-Pol polyprotein/retrotransposon, partial [Rhizoctonia solani 123E]